MRIVPITMHTKVMPSLKEGLKGYSHAMIQDLLADSSSVNVLDVPRGQPLLFEAPLTRISTATETMGAGAC